jgi:hypothetical protein
VGVKRKAQIFNMTSRITGKDTTFLFKKKLLNQYEVSYFRCNETGFIQTEEPYWLHEAYESAITKLDIGLVRRNIELSHLIDRFISKNFNPLGSFLDYAGGYGLLTRILRDKGYDFWNTDDYCQNLFATYNDIKYYGGERNFELVTAFELLEHLQDPIAQIKTPLQYSNHLLFSTELIPANGKVEDWWYIAPETGQHISFYTLEALKRIADTYAMNFYSNGKNLHLFSKKEFSTNPFSFLDKRLPFFYRKIKKVLSAYENKHKTKLPNLAESDYQKIKEIIASEK